MFYRILNFVSGQQSLQNIYPYNVANIESELSHVLANYLFVFR